MGDEELQGIRRIGEDADGSCPAHADRIGVAIGGEDVGKPIDHRHHEDDITRGGLRNQQLQPILVEPADPHELPGLGCFCARVRTIGVEIGDGGR